MVEFLKLAITGRTMHPGAHVAFQLFIWLVAVVAVVFTSLYVTDWDVYYDYPGGDPENLEEKSQMYETVLLGFDCVLVFIHFVLFCGACAETNEYNKARRGTIVVEVPVPVPAGTPIPEGHLPYYMRPQTFVPQPGAQQVQYSVPMVPQVARQGPGGGSITGQSQSAAIYGGYYAPAPPNMWAPSQQHQGNAQHYQGYYAPVSAPTMTPANSARREPPVPALASSSGSRRSQRLA
ncbi:hypothetical protein N0V88_006868 [Collariella sp. IMI 366227]|nr:hypothetical protein N0V88_006868 [Collariella sp. IMI 366227]